MKCFADNCKWRKQGENCVHCSHPKAVHYLPLSFYKRCDVCGRFAPMWLWKIYHTVLEFFSKKTIVAFACGKCTGRGEYVYPHAYEDCDCGGYEKSTK